MTDESRPLEPELQRIVDRTVQSLLAVFYVDGVPVVANDECFACHGTGKFEAGADEDRPALTCAECDGSGRADS